MCRHVGLEPRVGGGALVLLSSGARTDTHERTKEGTRTTASAVIGTREHVRVSYLLLPLGSSSFCFLCV